MMEQDQHKVQDAAEKYAVYVMQRTAEELGVAGGQFSRTLERNFQGYLENTGIDIDIFLSGEHRHYKENSDRHLPEFVARLARTWEGCTFDFEDVEAEYRNLGLKGDFLISTSMHNAPFAVSLKNYAGASGISRPQVASGTFASFAASFVFRKTGVGTYEDPRTGGSFKGSNVSVRNEVLNHLQIPVLIEKLAKLDQLQQDVRKEFLAPDCEFYDKDRVRNAALRVSKPAVEVVLDVLDEIGAEKVRANFLERIGFDGKEHVLFIDSERYVDSITNGKFDALKEDLNSSSTTFSFYEHGQGIRFEFATEAESILKIDVPFTINTNGAWFRPKLRFEGTQVYRDKGHLVELQWGQRRPYKSKEIATSVNTYVDLSKTGIFET